MSKALDEFLALRQASEAAPQRVPDRGDPHAGLRNAEKAQGIEASGSCPEEGPATKVPTGTCQPELASPVEMPATELMAAALAAYFADLLAAHPNARPVKDRSGLADYLARAVIHRYGDPKQVPWHSEPPLRRHRREGAFWVARCPAGHLTDEAIESHQVVGWACEQCKRVYDASECRLVPRGDSAIGPGRQAGPGGEGLA